MSMINRRDVPILIVLLSFLFVFPLQAHVLSARASFPFGRNGGGSTKNGSKLFLEMLTKGSRMIKFSIPLIEH